MRRPARPRCRCRRVARSRRAAAPSCALQPSWPAPVKQTSGAEPRRAEHGLRGIVALRHGVHLHLRVLGERVADPAGAQLRGELVVRRVHDDDVERVHETACAFDQVLVTAVERCEPSGRHAARLGARHGRNDAGWPGDAPACGIMRAVSGPRVIVVGAGVYGLGGRAPPGARGRRRHRAGGARGGRPVSPPRPGRRACCASSTARCALHRARPARPRAVAGAGGPARRDALRRDRACSGSQSRSRSYLHDSLQTSLAAGLPVRLLEPAEAVRQFPAFSSEGIAAVLHDEAGGVLHARRATLGLARLARAAGVDAARGRRRARRRRTASSSSPTAAASTPIRCS